MNKKSTHHNFCLNFTGKIISTEKEETKISAPALLKAVSSIFFCFIPCLVLAQDKKNDSVCELIKQAKKPVAYLIDKEDKLHLGPINIGEVVRSYFQSEGEVIPTAFRVVVAPQSMEYDKNPYEGIALSEVKSICPKSKTYKVGYLTTFDPGYNSTYFTEYKKNGVTRFRLKAKFDAFIRIGDFATEHKEQNLYQFNPYVLGEVYDPHTNCPHTLGVIPQTMRTLPSGQVHLSETYTSPRQLLQKIETYLGESREIAKVEILQNSVLLEGRTKSIDDPHNFIETAKKIALFQDTHIKTENIQPKNEYLTIFKATLPFKEVKKEARTACRSGKIQLIRPEEVDAFASNITTSMSDSGLEIHQYKLVNFINDHQVTLGTYVTRIELEGEWSAIVHMLSTIERMPYLTSIHDFKMLRTNGSTFHVYFDIHAYSAVQ